MQVVAGGVLVAAAVAGVAGYVWLLVVAFRVHAGWAAAVLLLAPLGPIAFVAAHPRPAWRPFTMMVGSLLFLLVLTMPASIELHTDVPRDATAAPS